MYGLMGKFVAHSGQRDALIDVLLRAAKDMERIEGCYLYVVSRDPNDGDGVWVTEVWHSQEDHQASLTHEAVQALISEGRPLIASMSDRMEFEPVGGKGLPD